MNYTKNIVISILIILSIGFIFISNKNSDNVTLDEVRLKDVKEENSMFAIMIQDGDNYIPYEQETWPTENYTFNGDKSGCLDSEGKKIEGITLNFDESTKKVKVETAVTSYCYIYFDKKLSKAGDVIKDKVGKRGLIQTSDDTDLDYRYVGNNTVEVDNYICFGTTDTSTCKASNGNNNYMYRIIGIDTSGRLKLIKNTSIGNNAWHSYADQNAVWESGTGKIEAELHKNLNNGTFLESTTYVPNGWSDKIANTKWYIGDSNGAGGSYTNTGDNVWKWESASKVTTSSKIGLMYLSDYYYSYDGTGAKDCYGNDSTICKTSWLHLSNSGDSSTTSSSEWTMSRYNLYGSIYGAWYVHYDGTVKNYNLANTYAVRPVFYLTAETTISGGNGTLDEPYIIN